MLNFCHVRYVKFIYLVPENFKYVIKKNTSEYQLEGLRDGGPLMTRLKVVLSNQNGQDLKVNLL